MSRLLFDLIPALAERMPHVTLGVWPSAIDRVEVNGQTFFAKREDLSTEGYAGNKIRPLELVFGEARTRGANEVWATGAWGSNHALATVVHAERAGLAAGALLWSQPRSKTAVDNLRATIAAADYVRWAPSIVAMPLMGLWIGQRRKALVMAPGAATPYYALGHAQGALELAVQMKELGCDEVGTIVLPVGSTCTTVGLLVGTALAAKLGLVKTTPMIEAVRVTPWPVTSAFRIARMAVASAELLGSLGGPRLDLTLRSVLARLRVKGDELGGGYGEPTPDGWRAIATHLDAEMSIERVAPGGLDPDVTRPLRLDTTYSAKGAAYLMKALPTASKPVVFWMTKSAWPLPSPDLLREAAAPTVVRRWLAGPLASLG